MNKVYLVLERESPEDYDVVFITMDEKMAKDISGEDSPSTYWSKKNDETNCFYEERELNREYEIHEVFRNLQ